MIKRSRRIWVELIQDSHDMERLVTDATATATATATVIANVGIADAIGIHHENVRPSWQGGGKAFGSCGGNDE